MKRLTLAGLFLAGTIAACGNGSSARSSAEPKAASPHAARPSASDRAKDPIDFTDPSAVRVALDALRDEAATGRPIQFFADPEAGFAGLVLRGGASGTLLRVDASGKVSSTAQQMQADSQLSYSAIDVRAPSRILAALKRGEGIEPQDVDAMIFGAGGALPEGSTGAGWAITVLGGGQFLAAGDGSSVQPG